MTTGTSGRYAGNVTSSPAKRSARRAFVSLVPLALAAALAAGCGGGSATSGPAESPATPRATASPSDVQTPPASAEPSPTLEPTAEPTAEPTTEPTAEPTAEPTVGPTPTRTPGSADVCTGNDENRAFYASVATAVAWDVYCPVLPSGWYVDSGRYQASAGGRLVIAYKGPGGRRLEIREGAYCADQDDCPPGGADAGPASFGGMAGRLVDLGGSWIVVVGGDHADWEAKGIGMDGSTLVGLTADFALVGE